MLATDDADKGQLLLRRGQVLLSSEDPADVDDAVSALRQARAAVGDTAEVMSTLADALARAGKPRDATAIVEAQISAAETAASPGEVAALLVRLSELRLDALEDASGARAALERALELVPGHPTAMARMARLVEAGADPSAYAEALVSQARATTDEDARIVALLTAGRLYQKTDDTDAARAAFEEVLSLSPTHPDATWALSDLAAGGGDLEAAKELLESRLIEESLTDDERARVLTELAALARRAGVDAAAEHRLSEALEARPGFVPAVTAQANLLYGEKRYEELESFLLTRRVELEDAPADVRVELERLLADAYEKLGRGDEAYAVLLEADTRFRGELSIKLALGENRFAAKRWREAALHLSSLAEHPDAEAHAQKVATGLAHAAVAETRSLRPERALPLYEAALRLHPANAAALHAMAEDARENNRAAEAAAFTEREAAATTEPLTRVRLFDQAGDAHAALGDDAAAMRCFDAAVQAASPLEARHVPLLQKLADKQRSQAAHAGLGRTSELLASFAPSEPKRAVIERQAAEAYLEAGEESRALQAAERALAIAPLDEQVVWVASTLLGNAGEHERLASLLARALGAWDSAERASGGILETSQVLGRTLALHRRAELWRRLGEARHQRGDARGANVAWERAVNVAAESDGGLEARRQLVASYGRLGGRGDDVIRHLRWLVQEDREPAEVLALARHLAADTAAGPVDEDGAVVTLEVARALGEALSPKDEAFLRDHPQRSMAADEGYGGSIDAGERARLLSDPDDAPLVDALGALFEAAPLILGDAATQLDVMGIEAAERVTPKERGDAVAILSQVSKALDAPPTVPYKGAIDDFVQPVCASPPLVVLGPRLFDMQDAARLRFLLGRAVELARPERVMAVGLPAARFSLLVAGLLQAFGSTGIGRGPELDEEAVRAEANRLRSALPLAVRTRIEQSLRGVDPATVSPGRYRAACERAGDRAGLLVCGDPGVAIELTGGREHAGHLVAMAVKAHFLAARAKLGMG